MKSKEKLEEFKKNYVKRLEEHKRNYKKQPFEIAYENEYNSDYRKDLLSTYTREDAKKFIPFYKMMTHGKNRSDEKMIDIILKTAETSRFIEEGSEKIKDLFLNLKGK